MSEQPKSKDAEEILSEFDSRTRPGPAADPAPEAAAPAAEPAAPEPAPEAAGSAAEPAAEPAAPEAAAPGPAAGAPRDKTGEERDVVFVGTKPIMTYVSATLTQLSSQSPVKIKARGRKITQAVDVSQMIVKRMNTVGYTISDVKISSDSLESDDGRTRKVSTIEIAISRP